MVGGRINLAKEKDIRFINNKNGGLFYTLKSQRLGDIQERQ